MGRGHRIRMEQTFPQPEPIRARHITEGEWRTIFDWVAIQRLKRIGLVEERGGTTMTTKEGQRALGRMSATN